MQVPLLIPIIDNNYYYQSFMEQKASYEMLISISIPLHSSSALLRGNCQISLSILVLVSSCEL